MAHREPMASADAAWLHMDRPTNLMTVTAVLWFDQPVDWDLLTGVVEERLVARYRRFRQRVVEERSPLRGPCWEDDPAFDLASHIRRAVLAPPGDRAALEAYVSAHLGEALDPSRPLWEIHLIDGYGRGSAVFVRMHHCIADGIALARVLLSLTGDSCAGGTSGEPVGAWTDRRAGPLRSVAGLARQGLRLVASPARLAGIARATLLDAAILGRLVLLPPDVRSILRGPVGVAKRVVWSDPVALDAVKAAGRASGATVNDVLLAAVAGAVGRYLAGRGHPVDDLRAIVPFNLRPLDEPVPPDLGNRFGLVFLDLPVGTMDPRERLATVTRRTAAIKRSPQGAVTYGVLAGMGRTPLPLEKLIVDFFTAKGSMVLTNVPGPRATVTLAGTPLAGLIFWVPRSGGIGVGVSIFSYAGEVTVGLAVDSGLVPDPDVLVDAFADELGALLALDGAT